MRKIISVIVLSSALIAASPAVLPLHCKDAQKKPQAKSFEGRVSYINWVTSIIRINGVGGEMEFYVPKNTPISKLGSRIWLPDINILDNAIVRYYEDPSGVNLIVNITITVV